MYQRQAFKLHVPLKKTNQRLSFANPMRALSYFVAINALQKEETTQFCHKLKDVLGEDKVLFIEEESYFKCLKHLPLEKRQLQNMQDPSFFDFELLTKHMDDFLFGRSVSLPKYDLTDFTRKLDYEYVLPRPIIVFSGTHLFEEERIEKKFNHKVFIHRKKHKLHDDKQKHSTLLKYKKISDQYICEQDSDDKEIRTLCHKIISEIS